MINHCYGIFYQTCAEVASSPTSLKPKLSMNMSKSKSIILLNKSPVSMMHLQFSPKRHFLSRFNVDFTQLFLFYLDCFKVVNLRSKHLRSLIWKVKLSLKLTLQVLFRVQKEDGGEQVKGFCL